MGLTGLLLALCLIGIFILQLTTTVTDMVNQYWRSHDRHFEQWRKEAETLIETVLLAERSLPAHQVSRILTNITHLFELAAQSPNPYVTTRDVIEVLNSAITDMISKQKLMAITEQIASLLAQLNTGSSRRFFRSCTIKSSVFTVSIALLFQLNLVSLLDHDVSTNAPLLTGFTMPTLFSMSAESLFGCIITGLMLGFAAPGWRKMTDSLLRQHPSNYSHLLTRSPVSTIPLPVEQTKPVSQTVQPPKSKPSPSPESRSLH